MSGSRGGVSSRTGRTSTGRTSADNRGSNSARGRKRTGEGTSGNQDFSLNAKQVLRSTDRVRVLNSPVPGADYQVKQSNKDGYGEVTGKTIREQRLKDERRSRRRRFRPAMIVAVVVILLIFAAAATYLSPAFTINSIRVEGTVYLREDHLAELAQVPSDTTLLRLDSASVARRVSLEPWVADVRVRREFPATLVLEITERKPVALVELGPTSSAGAQGLWLLSGDGTWLGPSVGLEKAVLNVDTGTLIKIKDVASGLKPTAGDQLGKPRISSLIAVISAGLESVTDPPSSSAHNGPADSGVSNALGIIMGLSDEMRGQIISISAPSAIQTTLYLKSNVEIAFGNSDDVSAKEAVIQQLIARHGSELMYVNIRVVDRPTIRLTTGVETGE